MIINLLHSWAAVACGGGDPVAFPAACRSSLFAAIGAAASFLVAGCAKARPEVRHELLHEVSQLHAHLLVRRSDERSTVKSRFSESFSLAFSSGAMRTRPGCAV